MAEDITRGFNHHRLVHGGFIGLELETKIICPYSQGSCPKWSQAKWHVLTDLASYQNGQK